MPDIESFSTYLNIFLFIVLVNSLLSRFAVINSLISPAPGVSSMYFAVAFMIVFAFWYGIWGAFSAYPGCMIGAGILADVPFSLIMYNLLSNAIKFTPETGKVWLDYEITNGNDQISVSDNGIGIPLEQQNAIFDPFKQVSSSTNRTHGGTGLGLAIVKYYVEMHSGEIHVESEVDKGSTFNLTIPVD